MFKELDPLEVTLTEIPFFEGTASTEVPMSLDPHALTSIASSLEDITNRLAHITKGMSADDDDAIIELNEVQRQLTTASRRLEKVVHRQRSR